MVDIVVGSIPQVYNNQSNAHQQQPGRDRKGRKDRRKSKVDRRQSVRDGIVVTLSQADDRRKGTDRRKP